MTTVAWDGETLAADTQMTSGTMKSRGKKLHRVGRYKYAAFCGDVSDCQRVMDWLKDGGVKPSFKDDAEIEVLLLDKRKAACYHLDQSLVMVEQEAPFAIGSGAMAAMGAMMMGADAKKAVEIAAKVDSCTGGDVDTISLNKRKAHE